jgi:hypothetical protein
MRDCALGAESIIMKSHAITTPEIALIAGTRGMLGAGIGLLAAGRLNRDQRRAAGFALLAVGVVTTFPLIASVFRRKSPEPISARATEFAR